MRNLDYQLKTAETTPQTLAKKLNCDTSYVSQLRNGFRPITFEAARQIEEAEGWGRLTLDDPPSSVKTVTEFTEADIDKKIQSLARELFHNYKRPAKGDFFDTAVRLCIIDARERGFSEGRVRFIVQEFLK